MSTDDPSHSALLETVAARLPVEYRDAYLEGFARVRGDQDGAARELRRSITDDVDARSSAA